MQNNLGKDIFLLLQAIDFKLEFFNEEAHEGKYDEKFTIIMKKK